MEYENEVSLNEDPTEQDKNRAINDNNNIKITLTDMEQNTDSKDAKITDQVENKDTNIHDVSKLTDKEIKAEKLNIMKNILLISIAFLFVFNAFQGLSRLQSSLHIDAGMGTTNSAVLYAALMLSCLLVPKFMINYIGYKWTMPIAMTGYILWMAANGYAVWETMVPASLIVGLCAAPLWAAQRSYFRIISTRFAELTQENAEDVITRFLGLFFCFFQISSISGSIISSTVLRPPESNITDDNLCGLNDCPWFTANNTSYKPSDSTVWTMLGIYIGIAVLGVFIVIIFVDELPKYLMPERETKLGRNSLKLIASTVNNLKFPKQLTLIPLTMYTGFEQGFFNAEFTRSYVTCTMGIWQVGFVTIPYGIMNALSSFTSGRIVKYTGRIPLFTAGFLSDFIIQIVLMTWMPTREQNYVLYILAVMWGFSDAMWQTQLNSMYGSIFPDPVPAFANNSLWGSLGFVIAFAYSQYLCTDVKLYILISMLIASAAGYYITEFIVRREKSEEEIKEEVYDVISGIDNPQFTTEL